MNDDLLAGSRTDTYTPTDWVTGEKDISTDTVIIPSGTGVVAEKTVLGIIDADGEAVPSLAAAEDGSEVPKCILVHGVDATSADVEAAVYVGGCFNPDLLVFGTGHDADTVKAPLRNVGILLKTPR